MKIHRETGVYTSPYPCPQFMQAVGIWEDYQVLLSNGGLDNFLTDEPAQFAKLTMGVVQDFKCNLSSTNPMVQYKSIIILSTCPLLIFVQLFECHNGDHARR